MQKEREERSKKEGERERDMWEKLLPPCRLFQNNQCLAIPHPASPPNPPAAIYTLTLVTLADM